MHQNAITERFAANLRFAIKKLGYSQLAFAKRMRSYQSFVSDVIAGKRILRIHTAERFAKAVGMELWQVLLPQKQFIEEFNRRHKGQPNE